MIKSDITQIYVKSGERVIEHMRNVRSFWPLLAGIVWLLTGCANDKLLGTSGLIDRNKAVVAQAVNLPNTQTTKIQRLDGPKLPDSTSVKPPQQKPSKGDGLDLPNTEATLALDNLPLPQFIQAVYAGILKQNLSVDPQIQSRSEIISLRSGKPQNATQIFAAATTLLRLYGIAVYASDGLVRVLPSSANVGVYPEIFRGRSMPDIPSGLRPIFVWAPIEKVRSSSVLQQIKTFYPGIQITDDPANNALLIGGTAEVIGNVLETLKIIDQPLFRSQYSVRIDPVYWTADELSKRIYEFMVAQGYQIGSNPNDQAPMLLIPVAQVNALFVFANSETMINHITKWAKDLDQPGKSTTGSGGFITYYLQNTDADSIAKTLNQVMGGGSGSSAPATATAATRVVVNPASNSLIIKASQTEYQQLHALLKELDRPARSALITATLAEVRLTDSTNFGFNWLLAQFSSRGFNWNISSAASSALGSRGAGINVAVSRSANDPRALLTALASENKIKILSNPSLVTRSGETASISVGQEVPILTSQVTNNATTTGITQTIQYRSTGVQLRIKPVIHSSGRIDLEVSQEVSAAQANETGVNSTPVILSRKLDTKVSVSDGQTMLMGGLISNTVTGGNSGLPYLKDIPVLGNIFKTADSNILEKTELVLLITCYTMENDFEAQAITNAFRSQFPWAAVQAAEAKAGVSDKAERQAAPAVAAEPPSGSRSPDEAAVKGSPPSADKTSDQKPSEVITPQTEASSEGKDSAEAVFNPADWQGSRALDAPPPPPPAASAASPTPAASANPSESPQQGPADQIIGAGKGKPVTDPKLLQELMEAMKGVR